MPQFETIGNVCATVTVFTVRMMDSPPEELPTYTIFTPDELCSIKREFYSAEDAAKRCLLSNPSEHYEIKI